MHYRPFAQTGLFVSELCLGTMTFGGKGFWEVVGKMTQSEVDGFIQTAFDAGVNFIDTADVYSEGESERLVGAALAKINKPRDQVIVATKVRGRTGPGPNQVGLSRSHILSAIDASLSRLKLDYVDLYQIHGTDRETPIEETVRALDDVVKSGKVRYVGFCNLAAYKAMKALAYGSANGKARFVSAQMYYSIASRDIEREIVPFVKEEGLALLPWSPLAGGLLTGKFDFENPGPEGSRRTSFDFPPVDKVRAAAVVNAMRKIATGMGISVSRVALAWLLSKPYVTSVIIGAKTPLQLDDNLAATNTKLSEEDVAALDAYSALPSEYPGWMIESQDRERRPS